MDTSLGSFLVEKHECMLMVRVFPGLVTYWRDHVRFSCRFQRSVDEESWTGVSLPDDLSRYRRR